MQGCSIQGLPGSSGGPLLKPSQPQKLPEQGLHGQELGCPLRQLPLFAAQIFLCKELPIKPSQDLIILPVPLQSYEADTLLKWAGIKHQKILAECVCFFLKLEGIQQVKTITFV